MSTGGTSGSMAGHGHACTVWVVAGLSGSALVSINEVSLRRARLILGWVTVYW